MLTPIDIENAEFKKAALGYSQEEVDDFLDKVIVDFEKLYKDNAKLTGKINTLEDNLKKYSKLEESIKSAVVLAEKAAAETKALASEKAANIIKQAENDAEEIIHNANKELYALNAKITALKMEYENVSAKVRIMLESQLEMLNYADKELDVEPSENSEIDEEEVKLNKILDDAEKNAAQD